MAPSRCSHSRPAPAPPTRRRSAFEAGVTSSFLIPPPLKGRGLLWAVVALLALLAAPAFAQSFPALTGRVVDNAHLLQPDQAAALDAKLAQLEQQSGRQMVVATIPDLQGYPIEDYGYQLGRKWGLGDKKANDGLLLL
ncbi:MAG: TPM domain-containing protein, partial [Sphingomonas sp.]|nr:TPM domain-containing protein [Sphingomonas sp.]